MPLPRLETLPRRTSATLITAYQRHLSPRKGFPCAHRVLHGDLSCSEYIKRAVLRHGVFRAIAPARRRLQNCKAASQILSTRHSFHSSVRGKVERHCGRDACAEIGCEGCAHCLPEWVCGGLDCSALDCAAVGCGSCF